MVVRPRTMKKHVLQESSRGSPGEAMSAQDHRFQEGRTEASPQTNADQVDSKQRKEDMRQSDLSQEQGLIPMRREVWMWAAQARTDNKMDIKLPGFKNKPE
eukprot:TRINITY_DN16818_c0_g1_i1.p1 TRINITY_DN16818_c0_g1~~TRINITY_DN16818_c0_g1_i1.p1  ORF type:complete len:101 (-),score=14.98 TRINITY_DN16818_c0_g1_i1:479-781(-)